MLKIGVKGLDQLRAHLEAKKKSMSDALEGMVIAGAQPVANEAARLSPLLSGTNASSILEPPVKDIQKTATSCRGKIGPTTPYGRRLEYGFVGADSLGRVYHQRAQPYMRPAAASMKEEAKQEMLAAFKEAINS